MTKRTLIALGVAVAILVTGATAPVSAVTITKWGFDSLVPDGDTTTGRLTTEIGSGTLTFASGVLHDGYRSGFANHYDDSGLQTQPAYGASAMNTTALPVWSRYIQFAVDTTGYTNITFSLNHRFSNTAINTASILFTTDGSSWNSVGSYTATAGDIWLSPSFALSSAADNNPLLAIRVAIDVDPVAGTYKASRPTSNVAATGTWRLDDVTFSGTVIPEPGSMIALGAGLVSFAGIIRRGRKV